MNKKLNSLCENHLFTKTYAKGASSVNKFCAVYAMKKIKKAPNGSLPASKLGIAVNAKLGGAVERNRVKRIIREAYRHNLSKIAPGNIIVISARGAAFSKNVKSTHIEKVLDVSFSELGLYKGQTLKIKEAKTFKTYSVKKGSGNAKTSSPVKSK